MSAIERIAEVLDISPMRLLVESSGDDMLLEDRFVREIYPLAKWLTVEQKNYILKILRAITQ